MAMNLKKSLSCWWLLAIMTVLFFIQMLYTHFVGDDLAYAANMTGPQHRLEGWRELAYMWKFHWQYVNGRLPNFLMMLVPCWPHWLLSLMCAAAFFMMYWTALKASRARGLWSFVLVALVSWALPWWAGLYIFACQLNYVWASAFAVGAYLLIFNELPTKKWIVLFGALLCLMAGMFHEGEAAALCVGFIAYGFLNRWHPTKSQKIMLVAFFIGAFLAVCSPGIIHRATNNIRPDDSLLWMFIKSDLLAGILWAGIIVAWIVPRWRPRVKAFFSNPVSVLAFASLVSMVISLRSGIVGRSGWFAELFALIVLVNCLSKWKTAGNVMLETLIAALLLYQSADLMAWQARIHKDYENFEREYLASDDGVVEMSPLLDIDLPWWTLGRLQAVPDADDMYALDCISKYYYREQKWPVVVLPGDVFVDHAPADMLKIDYPDSEVYVAVIDGREYVVNPVRGKWKLTPRINDPGERWTLIPLTK